MLKELFPLIAEAYFIFYLFCITAAFYLFTRPLFAKKWTAVVAALSYFFTMIVLDKMPYILSNFEAYLLGNVVAFVVMIAVEKGNIAAKFLYSNLFFAVRWLLPSIFQVITRYTVEDWILAQDSLMYLMLSWTVEYSCLFMCFVFICHTFHRYLTTIQIHARGAFILCIPASISSMSYYLVKFWQDNPRSVQVELVLAFYYVALLCILVVFVRIYVAQEQSKLALAQQSTLNTQLQLTKQHVTHIEGLYDELKCFKHDLGNHVEVLEQLLQQNDTENATYYMTHIRKQSASLASLSTGHPVTDVILQQKIQQATQHGIDLQASFYFPKGLNIEPFDMSIVLNNLLDNAIEATIHCDTKTFSISCARQYDVFSLHVENPIYAPLQFNLVTGLPISSKASASHGIGLLNVQATLQKYSGHLTFREENDCLTVTALFVGKENHS